MRISSIILSPTNNSPKTKITWGELKETRRNCLLVSAPLVLDDQCVVTVVQVVRNREYQTALDAGQVLGRHAIVNDVTNLDQWQSVFEPCHVRQRISGDFVLNVPVESFDRLAESQHGRWSCRMTSNTYSCTAGFLRELGSSMRSA